MNRVFVFDYAEVLSTSPSRREYRQLAHMAGWRTDPFLTRYWSHRRPYDEGRVTAAGYWSAITELPETRLAHSSLLEQLVATDTRTWLQLNHEAVDLVRTLRENGYPTYLLSNAPESIAAALRDGPLSTIFNGMLFSSDIGVSKPESLIFESLLAHHSLSPQECVFFDDRHENVASAARLGLHAFSFTSVGQLRHQISRWTGQPMSGAHT